MAFLKDSSRLRFLDWTRGLAAVIMLQGHVFNSFTRDDQRKTSVYILSDFLGGMPSAVFLFLTGVTLAFLMDSTERKGLSPARRTVAALLRAGYLFLVAFLFRLQMWIFGGGEWTTLLRVDILNCMGFALCVMSIMAVFRTDERIRFCAILGLAIAAASPLVSQIDWSGVAPVLKDYLAPDYISFGFFPNAAFVAFGISIGSILRVITPEQTDRVMQWAALAGGVLIMGSQYLSNLPYSLYAKSDFWLDSPFQTLIKLGVILLMLAFAFLWNKHCEARWSWIAQLGTTSLLVYWVHIELVYGRWLGFWHHNLPVAPTAVAAAVTIALMLALSAARTHHRQWRAAITAFVQANFQAVPKRAPGA